MTRRVLVVDDEQSIRLTISEALSPLRLDVDEAIDGEQALQKLGASDYDLVVLDLRLPGLSGIEVLRRLRQTGSRASVLIVTAYGTVGNAIEAVKLGAVDFVQKPFSPDELRSLVSGALERGAATQGSDAALGYDECLARARTEIEQTRCADAEPWVRRAVALDPSRPEAYNLLGVVQELTSHPMQAQKYYRVALELDPRYQPARDNFDRSTTMGAERGKIRIGDSSRHAR